MITRTNTVLVANGTVNITKTDINTMTAGMVSLFDENKKPITTEAAAAAANMLYIGVCKGDMKVINPTSGAAETKKRIEWSNPIQKSCVTAVATDYSAPVQAAIEFNLTSATIVAGHRYVLRILYKDVVDALMQFTHTYEVIAADDNAQNLCDAFKKKIEAHPNRRVTVTSTSNKLKITAMEKDDNEGVNSINEYSIVVMNASLYHTVPGALLSNIPEAVPGVTVTETVGNPGKGYWKQVRDMEARNMGYKGHVFTGAYPAVEQEKEVNPSYTYDCLVIESDNKYLSPDNQYTKRAPLTTTLYVKAATLSSSAFVKFVKAFITGEVSA